MDKLTFLMIVDDPNIARFVSENGVGRLFVDLEYMGKESRQKGLDTWKSHQTAKDVTRVREGAPDAHLLVRINPLHENSRDEIDDVLERGADSIMLPMFHSRDELAIFWDLVADRAEAVPLIETAASLHAIHDILETIPVKRLHIGLNDLHLDFGMDFIFQPLADGMLEEAAMAMKSKNVRFGIGGIATSRQGLIHPELLLGEHVRLGSDAVILSRTLHRGAKSVDSLISAIDFRSELTKLQKIYQKFRAMGVNELNANKILVAKKVHEVIHSNKMLNVKINNR